MHNFQKVQVLNVKNNLINILQIKYYTMDYS